MSTLFYYKKMLVFIYSLIKTVLLKLFYVVAHQPILELAAKHCHICFTKRKPGECILTMTKAANQLLNFFLGFVLLILI